MAKYTNSEVTDMVLLYGEVTSCCTVVPREFPADCVKQVRSRHEVGPYTECGGRNTSCGVTTSTLHHCACHRRVPFHCMTCYRGVTAAWKVQALRSADVNHRRAFSQWFQLQCTQAPPTALFTLHSTAGTLTRGTSPILCSLYREQPLQPIPAIDIVRSPRGPATRGPATHVIGCNRTVFLHSPQQFYTHCVGDLLARVMAACDKVPDAPESMNSMYSLDTVAPCNYRNSCTTLRMKSHIHLSEPYNLATIKCAKSCFFAILCSTVTADIPVRWGWTLLQFAKRAGVAPRVSHVGIVLDDATGRRVFSGIYRFDHPCIPALLHTHLASASSALKNSMLRQPKSLHSLSRYRFFINPSHAQLNTIPFRKQSRNDLTKRVPVVQDKAVYTVYNSTGHVRGVQCIMGARLHAVISTSLQQSGRGRVDTRHTLLQPGYGHAPATARGTARIPRYDPALLMDESPPALRICGINTCNMVDCTCSGFRHRCGHLSLSPSVEMREVKVLARSLSHVLHTRADIKHAGLAHMHVDTACAQIQRSNHRLSPVNSSTTYSPQKNVEPRWCSGQTTIPSHTPTHQGEPGCGVAVRIFAPHFTHSGLIMAAPVWCSGGSVSKNIAIVLSSHGYRLGNISILEDTREYPNVTPSVNWVVVCNLCGHRRTSDLEGRLSFEAQCFQCENKQHFSVKEFSVAHFVCRPKLPSLKTATGAAVVRRWICVKESLLPVNPRQLHEKPLHSRIVTMLTECFRLYATSTLKLDNVYFRRDGATAHAARLSMDTLRTIFHTRIISRFADITWPAHSPDLWACDYVLRRFLKSRVFQTRPPHLNTLKERIPEGINDICACSNIVASYRKPAAASNERMCEPGLTSSHWSNIQEIILLCVLSLMADIFRVFLTAKLEQYLRSSDFIARKPEMANFPSLAA
ncbi:hypothetical protein PR048_033077 [Dryococelus australis]|uniref:Uncharacterized protein n=1 Tax=Dryococelus australis TaxID=614101 RepID=A0ABQ9G2C9_9NEOP|nr:hypothetical protein PR048_033077 [Dryococelus australis]